MAATPASPCPRTVLDAELSALGRELWAAEGEIGSEQLEAASMLVRAARELVGRPQGALDLDALALLQVAATCVSTSASERVDMADIAAALTLIAKRATALAGNDPLPHDARDAHVQATLAVITAAGTGGGASRDSSRSADAAPIDEP
jgi:hypothetical protein